MLAAATFPTNSQDPSYAPAILAAVTSGDYEMPFAKVTSTYNGHTGTFLMSADALKIGGVRYGVGAYLMQQIADGLGCLFPTPKLRDLQWQQRSVNLPPVTIWGYLKPPTWPVAGERGQSFSTNDMTLTATMAFISSKIDDLVSKSGKTGIVQNTGKAWVITNTILTAPGHGANYGWYYQGTCPSGQPCSNSPATPGLWMIQGPATGWLQHNLLQADYAQTINLVHRICWIDGVQRDLAEIYSDPELSGLVSAEGPLKIVRQPGVPLYNCQGNTITTVTGETICSPPPPPVNVEGNVGIDWKMVGLTAAASAAVIGGFWFMLKHAGRGAKRLHENPTLDWESNPATKSKREPFMRVIATSELDARNSVIRRYGVDPDYIVLVKFNQLMPKFGKYAKEYLVYMSTKPVGGHLYRVQESCCGQ